MEKHPIKIFIDEIFNQKSDQKRQKWANYLINQQYETKQDLKKITDSDWQTMSDGIPKKIQQDIKNYFKSIVQINNPEIITRQDQEQIISLLNEGMSPEKIVIFFKAKDTLRGQALLQKAKLFIKPPQPQPQNCKKLTAMVSGPCLPLFHYVGQYQPQRKYYTLMAIGESGSGKTTLLDAFVNKLRGVQYTDNWRWKLVDQNKINLQKESGKSKTSEITMYYINDIKNQFNVKIVDTPGFGDTEGISIDQNITKKFQQFFKEAQQLDYILFTIKSTETRLRSGARYVYDKVQQLFGIDAKDHFLLMCTFADGGKPLCIQTVGDSIHYNKYFVFNNSALYCPSYQASNTTKFFWRMGIESIQQFQQYIIKSNRRSLSLKLSSQVLEKRNYLHQSIKTSQMELKKSFILIQEAERALENLEKNKKLIQQNKSFTYQQPKPVNKYVTLNNYYQLCKNCQCMCCQYCVWPQGVSESQCTYFNGGKNCPKCPGKCTKGAHIRRNYIYQTVMVNQTITMDCKKLAYQQGLDGEQLYQQLFNEKIDSMDSLSKKIWKLSIEIKQDLNKLQEIALKPKLFTDEQFYLQMIKQQKQNKEIGWDIRVKALQDVLERIKTLGKVQSANKFQDLFPKADDFKQKYAKQLKGTKVQNSGFCQIY